jgi:hypothetical protein
VGMENVGMRFFVRIFLEKKAEEESPLVASLASQ